MMTDEARKIVAALRVVCGKRTCDDCPCLEWCHRQKENCLDDDAADMIEKLSAELKEARAMVQDAKEHAELFMEELTQVKRERDAAIADMEKMQGCICQACKHHYQPDPNIRKWSCRVLGEYWADICDHDGGLLMCGSFEWRGVQGDV